VDMLNVYSGCFNKKKSDLGFKLSKMYIIWLLC